MKGIMYPLSQKSPVELIVRGFKGNITGGNEVC